MPVIKMPYTTCTLTFRRFVWENLFISPHPDLERVKGGKKGKKRKKDNGIDGPKESPGETRVLSIPAVAAPPMVWGGKRNGKILYLGMGKGLVLMGWPRSGKVRFLVCKRRKSRCCCC